MDTSNTSPPITGLSSKTNPLTNIGTVYGNDEFWTDPSTSDLGNAMDFSLNTEGLSTEPKTNKENSKTKDNSESIKVLNLNNPISQNIDENNNTTIVTTSPYEWTTINRKRKSKLNNNSARELKKLQDFDKLFRTEKPHFDKFFEIKFPGCNITEDISPIKLDNDLKKEFRNAKIRKSGKSGLFIEVANKEQSDKIGNIKKLADTTVLINKHRSYNQVKGVIKTKSLNHDKEEEIQEHLKAQHVAEVKRVTIKRNNEIIKTNTYIITFNLLTCPKTIEIADWLIVRVEEYNYTPQQCYKCLKFGHVSKYCRKTEQTCQNCTRTGHLREECSHSLQCFHCKEEHRSTDKNCQKYICESKIVNYQMKNKIPRTEAVSKILAEFPQYEKFYKSDTDENRSERETNVNTPDAPQIAENTQVPQAPRTPERLSTIEPSQALEINPLPNLHAPRAPQLPTEVRITKTHQLPGRSEKSPKKAQVKIPRSNTSTSHKEALTSNKSSSSSPLPNTKDNKNEYVKSSTENLDRIISKRGQFEKVNNTDECKNRDDETRQDPRSEDRRKRRLSPNHSKETTTKKPNKTKVDDKRYQQIPSISSTRNDKYKVKPGKT